jgi:hypothetical protein
MHKPKIFLVGQDREHLITLQETGYVEEAVLQDFLVNYPDLLPGDQISPEEPRRWLLVAQEMAVPGEEAGAGRWSLDHLFLDQDGIPTFVECKRSTDTRARREVVAQMLDYAANGIEYWSMDRLRQAAAETAQSLGQSLDEDIVALVDNDEASIDEYWDTVEANLRAHRVRLVFVADSTPKELRRLVEFLNEEMQNVEVLAVEVKQYQRGDSEGPTALVPRVVGLTEAAREKRSQPRKRNLTRQEVLEGSGPAGRAFFARVLDLAQERRQQINVGTFRFSVRAYSPSSDRYRTFAFCTPALTHPQGWDELQLLLGELGRLAPNNEMDSLREELLGFGVLEQGGKVTLKAPITEGNLAQMNDIYDFMVEKVDELIAAYDKQKDGG